MLLVSFHLQRHMGNFLIQVYGPCVLLVVLSWVSFWLNREATADRVSLGITTVLTMTFLGLEARTDLPKVPYPTALDFFVFLSFAFIFATIIQFAIVHYFTKYGSGECYFSVDELNSSSDEEDSEREDANGTAQSSQHHHSINIGPSTSGTYPGKRCSAITSISGRQGAGAAGTDSRIVEVIPLSMCSFPMTPMRKTPKSSWTDVTCFGGGTCGAPEDSNGDPTPPAGSSSLADRDRVGTYSATTITTTSSSFTSTPTATTSLGGKPRRRSSTSGPSHRIRTVQHLTIDATPSTPGAVETVSTTGHRTRRRRKREPRFNSVSKIDRASRIFFPLLFLAINVFYWFLYLSRSERLPQQHHKTG
ncbi:AGAP011349-PA-like protein [Anopheles sinensis]|uniref:AGAP011349-PA-like protein n=1 Tax=Anopheles sinensis TaxID=74873 RepID=A0A084VHY3_ANOSI|nr:AGAP011349-PA-like protein [Anopheles sinensis]